MEFIIYKLLQETLDAEQAKTGFPMYFDVLKIWMQTIFLKKIALY